MKNTMMQQQHKQKGYTKAKMAKEGMSRRLKY